MNKYYAKTKKYWDTVFEKQNDYNPNDKLHFNKIENALQWISRGSSSILDFGCGYGRITSRCLDYGAKEILGIDISKTAIKKANSIMRKYNLHKKVKFKTGDISSLKNIEANNFDGVILFNIIDNLRPEDSKLLLKYIYNLLKKNGQIIVKMNPFIPQEQLKSLNMEPVSENLFQDDKGLYFWNIDNDNLEKILEPYFRITKYEEIEFKKQNMINRLFYLKK